MPHRKHLPEPDWTFGEWLYQRRHWTTKAPRDPVEVSTPARRGASSSPLPASSGAARRMPVGSSEEPEASTSQPTAAA